MSAVNKYNAEQNTSITSLYFPDNPIKIKAIMNALFQIQEYYGIRIQKFYPNYAP